MTRRTYLDQPDQLALEATITWIGQKVDGSWYVVTDRTPYYPQGGGQPGDHGTITSCDRMLDIVGATLAGFDVQHILQEEPADFDLGDVVSLSVDPEIRRLHSRIHTAGELICAAMKTLRPDWTVSSANHFPGASSVSFATKDTVGNLDQLAARLTELVATFIEKAYPVSIYRDVARADAERLVGYSLAAIPPSEPIRLVSAAPTYFRACVGTHVATTADIGIFGLRNIKLKKGVVSVGYDVRLSDITEQAA